MRVIGDICEGHGHDRRVGVHGWNGLEVMGRVEEEWGAGGGGGRLDGRGMVAGQASQMWADITALYFTLPSTVHYIALNSSVQDFKLKCNTKARYSNAVLQHIRCIAV